MQVVSNRFNELANGDIRPVSGGVYISFDKAYDDSIEFAMWDVSDWDSGDLWSPNNDNAIQQWDYYEYKNYTERLIDMSIHRELQFPYSIISAIADFSLNNYDKYFTPNAGSPVDSFIIPKRPIRLFQGFDNTLLPQFVGLTQGMPEISETDGTASFTAFDFLTQIYDMPIRETAAMRDVRTDEVLAEIFTQFGLSPGQYDLSIARNTIKFLFFERDQVSAGEVIRPLMQAEGGMLWLGEDGIIHFRPRLELPDTPTYTFDSDSVITCATVDEDEIINRVIITTDIREVQDWTTVYSKKTTDTGLDVVPANGTYVFKAELTDPLLDVEQPVYGQNAGVSWFTAAVPSGALVTSGVSITSVELKTNTYEMTIANTNAFSVNINQMSLWGQPALRISREPVVYENKDTDSIDKYDEQLLEIDSNFIQTVSAARSLALTILDEYSEYADILEVEVKGNPAIQLSDIVELDYEQYDGEYRVIAITNKLGGSKFTQVLKLRKYTPREWGFWDISTWDGGSVWSP